jgi:Asp/Glu/hydantoin racemase
MNSYSQRNENRSLIGILMLETNFPRVLGDIGNPDTFSFPVIYKKVHGASPRKVVIDADTGLVEHFIEAGKALVDKGAKAITTSCGFLALFHRQLVNALPVPVFTSSLLQVHLAHYLIRGDQKIGIITASKPSLTNAHLEGIGIQQYPIVIIGMEDEEEFNAVFIGGKETLDVPKCRAEIESVAANLIRRHPDVGAIILECTNMPPYADTIRRITGLPVFDAVTMVNYVYSTIATRAVLD